MALARIPGFEVERELGAGAMGTVYLVRRGEERFALKVMRSELLDAPDLVARFRREGELGQRIVHPNVVRTFEAGTLTTEEGSAPYLLLEYVEGKDLRALLTEVGAVPEALLRELAHQVAAGLEAIHAAGVLHGDLKPENVLLTEGHDLRISDLGVARRLAGREGAPEDGEFTGTLLYAAPELFLGATPSPSTDLYALGVLLYELATGENPFQRPTPLAVMQAQADLVPPPVTERRPALSAFLSELLRELMDKVPSARPRSAGELRDTLAAGEGSSWWLHRARRPGRARARTPRLGVERTTATYGRDAERTVLYDAWARACQGEGGVVLVEGEPGSGKTRLLDDLVQVAGAEDAHVLYGAFGADGGVGAWIESLAAHWEAADLTSDLAPYLTEFPHLVPAFAARVREETPPPGAAPLSTEAFAAVLGALLRGLAAQAPVLWLLDDAHHARAESIGLLLRLARLAPGHRVLFVVARSRAPASEEGDPLAALAGLPDVSRLTLPRLPAEAVMALLTEALHNEGLSERIGERVAGASDGLPLFVLDLVRALAEEGVLRRRPDGSFELAQRLTTFAMPSSVRSIVRARLDGLPEEDRALLDVAAVLSGAFEASLLARVLDLKPVLVLRRLALLERRTGLVRTVGARHRFDQKQVEEAIYRALPTEERRAHHDRVAEVLVGSLGEAAPEGRLAYRIARHHLLGARPAEALPYLDPALAFLERASLEDEFVDLVDAALAIEGLVQGAPRAELLLRLAARLAPRAGLAEALGPLGQALALAEAEGGADLRARARFFEARLHGMAGKMEEALAGFQRASELALEAGDEELAARATGIMGVVHDNAGRPAEGLPLLERHLAEARRLGRRTSEMIAACNLGLTLRNLGRPEEARPLMELHLQIAQETKDLRAEAVAQGNLAILDAEGGDLEAACRRHERNVELARTSGSRQSEGAACGNLGNELLALGEVERGLRLLERARAIASELGDARIEAHHTGSLAEGWAGVGRYEEALALYDRALPLVARGGDRRAQARTLLGRGRLLALLGRTVEAQACYEQGRDLARALGAAHEEAMSLLDLARLEERAGRTEAATAFADAAQARAVEGQAPVALAQVAMWRAGRPGGDPTAAAAAYRAAAPRMRLPGRAVYLRDLGVASGEAGRRREARDALRAWMARLSPALRAGLEERVPAYAEILAEPDAS